MGPLASSVSLTTRKKLWCRLCEALLQSANTFWIQLDSPMCCSEKYIQSDRIEGEFGVYRQSTGGNAFMTAGDVSAASKKRLARHAAKFLKSLEFEEEQHNRVCIGSVVIDDASAMEESVSSITLSSSEKSSCAYVTGWLEGKCDELVFTDDDPLVTSNVKNFVEEVSRGCLKIPHECTWALFRQESTPSRLLLSKTEFCPVHHGIFLQSGEYSDMRKLLWHLSNVILHGLHNLEKDHQKNSVLLQTSIKRARMSD